MRAPAGGSGSGRRPAPPAGPGPTTATPWRSGPTASALRPGWPPCPAGSAPWLRTTSTRPSRPGRPRPRSRRSRSPSHLREGASHLSQGHELVSGELLSRLPFQVHSVNQERVGGLLAATELLHLLLGSRVGVELSAASPVLQREGQLPAV